MTLRAYVWGMSTVTFFSIIALVAILNYIDPSTSGVIGKSLFFLVAFFVLSGFFNLVLLWLRKRIITTENIHANVGLSFRQGLLLALFGVGILLLQGMHLLVWWDGLILLGGIFLIEVYFVLKS